MTRLRGTPAVFLDRDGVLNRDSPSFIRTVEDLHVLPGVPKAVARLNRAGFDVVLVTNQSGLARGYITPENLEAIHERLRGAVRAAGGDIDAIYYCPHRPDEGCTCRKPAPGMVVQAAADRRVDLSRSYMVGDKPVDVACGKAAGCRTVLVLTGDTRRYVPADWPSPPCHVAADLPGAVDWILAETAAT